MAGEMVYSIAGRLMVAISMIWGQNDVSLQARSNTHCLCADKVSLKQKATGMGTPAAVNFRT